MSASYGRLQILVHPDSSRVTQESSISPFSAGGRDKDGRGRSRVHGGRFYGRGRGYGRGGRGGRCGRSYGQNPYKFSRSYETFL